MGAPPPGKVLEPSPEYESIVWVHGNDSQHPQTISVQLTIPGQQGKTTLTGYFNVSVPDEPDGHTNAT